MFPDIRTIKTCANKGIGQYWPVTASTPSPSPSHDCADVSEVKTLDLASLGRLPLIKSWKGRWGRRMGRRGGEREGRESNRKRGRGGIIHPSMHPCNHVSMYPSILAFTRPSNLICCIVVWPVIGWTVRTDGGWWGATAAWSGRGGGRRTLEQDLAGLAVRLVERVLVLRRLIGTGR